MNTWGALACRAEFEGRAAAARQAGCLIDATVLAIGADLCRAAAWTARYGAIEAERRVRSHCRDVPLPR